MTQAQPEKDNHKLPDDYWIFEELGSPVKIPSGHRASSNSSTTSKSMCKNVFEEKLRVYADNMRKLIITARKAIKGLKQENITLKRKLEASGLIECPACLFHFKPERKNRILPKYIKVFRGKLALEVEFSSLDEMSEWLTVNQLDENSDGLPTMLPNDQKLDLTTTGSLLHELVNEQKESETKQNRVVISTRRRLSHSRSSHNSPQPASRKAVGESDDVGSAHSSERSRDKSMKKNKKRERWTSPIFSLESSSTASDGKCEDSERKAKHPNDLLSFENCAKIVSSLKESLSMEISDTAAARLGVHRDYNKDSEAVSHAKDMCRLKDYKERDSGRTSDFISHRGECEEMKRSAQTERQKGKTSSTHHHSPHDFGEETGVKHLGEANDTNGKHVRRDSYHKSSRVSCRSDQPLNLVPTEKKNTSGVGENGRSTDSRLSSEPSGKENVAYHRESDRLGTRKVESSHHRRKDDVPESERHIVHGKEPKQDRHGDSQKGRCRREHVSIKDSVKHDAEEKDVRTTGSVGTTRDSYDRSHRHHSMKKSCDQHHNKRDLTTRRSPPKLSHRTEHAHSTRDLAKDYPKKSERTSGSYKDRAALSRNHRHGYSREENRRESFRNSDHPGSPSTSAKRRKLSTSLQKSDHVEDEEEALVVSDIDLVMVDEDEVEDGEILD